MTAPQPGVSISSSTVSGENINQGDNNQVVQGDGNQAVVGNVGTWLGIAALFA